MREKFFIQDRLTNEMAFVCPGKLRFAPALITDAELVIRN
jgi:hypothetical protein